MLYFFKRISFDALRPLFQKHRWLIWGLLGLLTIYLLLPTYVNAASIPMLPDCSQQGKLPATWASDLVAQIKILNSAATPTNNWAITYNFSSQTASNAHVLVFWASPISTRQVGSRSMWYTHDTTDPRKITYNIDSSKGDLYRVTAPVNPDGTVAINTSSGTRYDIPWAKTVSVPVTCAVINHRVPITDTTSAIYWDISSTTGTAQDVNLGFFDPDAATSTPAGGTGGTSTGMSKTDFQDVLVQFYGITLACFIGWQIIKLFRFKRSF